jgi:lysophospholipase L1-like esterase
MNQNHTLLVVIIILLLLLTTSAGLNLLLYRYANQYYLQLNGTRLDPLGVVFYEPSDPAAHELNQQKVRVVFYGDSRAYQWPPPPELGQFIFLNRGIGAQTSTQVVERFDNHITPLQPDILVVQVCINDLKTIPLYPHLERQIIDTCKANLEQIVDKARDQGAAVILTTIFPLGELPIERRLFWSDEVGSAIVEVNEYIYTLKNEGVIIYDTATVLADESGQVRAEYSFDFLHLNEYGYQALNKDLAKLLLKIGPEKTARVE